MTDNLIIKKESLTAIADAIRKKTGKTATMTVSQMKDEITGIEAGGGVIKFKNLDYFYYKGVRFGEFPYASLDTSMCTSMRSMFVDANDYFYGNVDLTSWNTSNLTNLISTFDGCYKLHELNLSGWDTRNVTNLNNMFYGCRGLKVIHLTGWDTNNVRLMPNFIYNCTSLKDIYIKDSELRADGQLKFKLPTSGVFDQVRKNSGKIHLSKTLESNYKAATNWSAYTDIMVFDQP